MAAQGAGRWFAVEHRGVAASEGTNGRHVLGDRAELDVTEPFLGLWRAEGAAAQGLELPADAPEHVWDHSGCSSSAWEYGLGPVRMLWLCCLLGLKLKGLEQVLEARA